MLNYVFPQLPPDQMVSFIRNGLNKTKTPKRSSLSAQGCQGTVAASLLKDAGHNVTILEADERMGGRVYTLKSDFTDGLYLEAGAMRIPHTHYLTLEYIKKFHLSVNRFINSTPNDIIYARGIKTRLKFYKQNPDILGFPVAPHERGKTASELLTLAIKPVTDFINQNPQRNWPLVIKELDKYSMDAFLRYNPFGVTLSPAAIEMIKVLLSLGGFPELSFLELLRELMILFTPDVRFYEIPGGNDQLPKAFLPQLKDNIMFGQKVTKITQHHNQVTIDFIHTKVLETISNHR